MGVVPTPLGARVLVDPAEVQMESRIVTPESSRKESATYGKVVAVGDAAEMFVPGETVIWGPRAGHEYKFNGKPYLMLSVSEIEGRVSGSSA